MLHKKWIWELYNKKIVTAFVIFWGKLGNLSRVSSKKSSQTAQKNENEWKPILKWIKYNYKTGLACLVICVVAAISLILTSIGIRLSYKVGACKMIPAVPTTTAIVKIHKNKRSSTIATNFQSSFTCFFFVFKDRGELKMLFGSQPRVSHPCAFFFFFCMISYVSYTIHRLVKLWTCVPTISQAIFFNFGFFFTINCSKRYQITLIENN